MTEQEIIKYLKENKTKGVAFVFMPKEVKEWACDNSRFIIYYNKFGWDDSPSDMEKYRPTDVIALPHDYEPKQEPSGEWVEFNIKDGVFYEAEMGVCYDWYEWTCFMAKNTSYKAFGGWQYKDSKRWYLAPAVKLQDGDLWNSYIIEERGEATPVTPIKIRFWKESR